MNDVMKMILSLVVGFVIAELALRATDPLDVQYFVNVAEYQGHTVPHPKYSYIVLRLAEVPHSRNLGFEQELYCGILANRCYACVYRLSELWK